MIQFMQMTEMNENMKTIFTIHEMCKVGDGVHVHENFNELYQFSFPLFNVNINSGKIF